MRKDGENMDKVDICDKDDESKMILNHDNAKNKNKLFWICICIFSFLSAVIFLVLEMRSMQLNHSNLNDSSLVSFLSTLFFPAICMILGVFSLVEYLSGEIKPFNKRIHTLEEKIDKLSGDGERKA
jgi:hypothetical protein